MNEQLIKENEENTTAKTIPVLPAALTVGAPGAETNTVCRQSVEDVVRQLHEDIGRRRKRAIRIAIWLGSFTLSVIGSYNSDVHGLLGWSITLIFLFLAASLIGCGMPTRWRSRQLQILADEAGGAEVQALLVMSREIQSARTQKALMDALIRSLPQMEESDAIRLSRRNRVQLNEALEEDRFGSYSKERADYVIAVIKAMEKIGDEKSLKHIRRLASMPDSVSSERRRVREAALECLPHLESRLERSKSPALLLRPSDINQNETLLRTVEAGISRSNATLVRPSDKE